MIKRKCWHCEDEFETDNKYQYYCSIECEERELETDVMAEDDLEE